MRNCCNCGASLYTGTRPYQIDELLCRDCQKSPPVQVRVLLDRARMAGFDFDRAWVFALGEQTLRYGEPDFTGGRIRWCHDTEHRREWKRTFADEAMRDVWRAAYELEPMTHSPHLVDGHLSKGLIAA